MTDVVASLRAALDPVLERAGYRWNDLHVPQGRPLALLWEALPEEFVRRVPGTRVVESYGDQWPPGCLDLWVYVDADRGVVSADPEGLTTSPEVAFDPARFDDAAAALADAFARELDEREVP